MSKPDKCDFCSKAFTWGDVDTGEIMKNEHGQHMHMGCYNQWCAQNPFVPPANLLFLDEPPTAAINRNCLTFESLPTNLSNGDPVSREELGEPLSPETLAQRAVARMEWPDNTDSVEAMDWQLD